MQVIMKLFRNIGAKYSWKISSYRLACAHSARYVSENAVPNIQNVPGLKLKSNEQFANAENCNICKQPFNQQRGVNRHHWYSFINLVDIAQAQFVASVLVKRSTMNVLAISVSSSSILKNRSMKEEKISVSVNLILNA